MFGKLFLFIIFPLFSIFVYVTMLPQHVLIALVLIFLVAFFLPTFTVSIRIVLVFGVIALAFLGAYVAFMGAEPSTWLSDHPVLRYVMAITDWDLLPQEFWKYSAAIITMILTFISAWGGDHFAGDYLVTHSVD